MTKTSIPWRIAIHGGAGVTPGRDYGLVEAHLRLLIGDAARWLASGMPAIDAVEATVHELEASGFYVAGRGSAPSSAGHVEHDASIMDGARAMAGAIGAARDLVSPIAAARAVMERSSHVLLVGDGAVEFARNEGLETVADPARHYQLPVGVEEEEMHAEPAAGLTHGTVGAVARDREGRLAAATSTGGLFGKHAGRVGDTGIPGAGTWADGAVAVSCTGIGEAFILAGGAHDVAARVRHGGQDLRTASAALLDRVKALGGDGGLIALDAQGNHAMPFNSPGLKRAFAGEGLETFVAIL